MESMNLYVVRDIVADQSGPVFEAVNDGVAARQYRAIVKDAENPADYQLLCIGRVDRSTGQAEIDRSFCQIGIIEVAHE